MKAKRFVVSCPLCLVVACVAGCGPGGPATQPVTGKVTFSDGSPLTQGTVIFYSREVTPMGQIKEDGSYTLYTGEKQGAPTGSYTVYFMGTEAQGYVPAEQLGAGGRAGPQALLVPDKYLSPETSGIRKEVSTGKNDIPITVERAG